MTIRTSTPFGTLLRQHRLAAGLSQEILAERAGISAAAIAALESGRRATPRPETLSLLADALGLSPTARAGLIAAAGAREPAAPAVSPVAPPHAVPPTVAFAALPVPLTTLIGRERDVGAVTHLLQEERRGRLVTLTGPGGVGKTRLALAVALALRDSYPDGVIFVDLSALRDPALVAPTIAQALGLREEGGRAARDLLLTSLRDRTLLLLLDNFEQVVDAAPLLGDLVAACPRLAVLVTSRTALRLRGEQRFSVLPLAVPAPDPPDLQAVEHYAAVRLFVARARAVQPDFRFDAANASALMEICRKLDGLPLAIELAAARIVLLSPEALLERLERRLATLTRGARDLPSRQQTLRATIDWSYALLTAEEQALFRRFSVFSGGASLEAVEAVCDADGALDAFNALGSLVDKSLLRTEGADLPRVGMLETLREYAGEQLHAAGETERLQETHAAYYLALAAAAEPHLRGAEQAVWLKRLDDDHDNLRATLQWTLRHAEVTSGLRLGGALWQFWYFHGYIGEGRRWLAQLLALPYDDAQASLALARAKVLSGAGTFAELQGDYAASRALLEEGLAICRSHGDAEGVAMALNDLGVLADSEGDLDRAMELFTEALALFRGSGHTWGTALVLSNMGYLAREQGAYARAAALNEESLALFRKTGDSRNIAFTLNHLGEALCDRGDYARAVALFEETLALRRRLGDTLGVAISLTSLGNVARAQGDYRRAAELYHESLALFRHLGATWNIACTLESLSAVAIRQAAFAEAAAFGEQSLALFQEIHDPKGRARALTGLAQVALAQGDAARAERLCHQSLALYRECGPIPGVLSCLECLAHALGGQEGAAPLSAGPAQAVRLWAATAARRQDLGIMRPPTEETASAQAIAAARHSLGPEAFTEAWAAGSTLSLAQAVDAALQTAPS